MTISADSFLLRRKKFLRIPAWNNTISCHDLIKEYNKKRRKKLKKNYFEGLGSIKTPLLGRSKDTDPANNAWIPFCEKSGLFVEKEKPPILCPR